MAKSHQTGTLAEIPVRKIQPNPENPRVAFRQGELEELQESIRRYGVQVPIAVFRRAGGYVLIDGERRWRCASKLNLKTIPALIQKEPGPLENLLLMFNIHALREQWDLLTIALKLPRIISLIEAEGRDPTEGELSAQTGLSRSVIRRSRLLMSIPQKHQDALLEELKKPKSKQLLSEDLFIEIEKALRTAIRAMPDAIPNKDHAREVLLRKYKDKVVENIVDFRKLAKIARAGKVGANVEAAEQAISRLVTEPRYSIDQAWADTVAEAYAERDILSRIDSLLARMSELKPDEIDEDVRERLEELVQRAEAILKASA